MGESTNPRATLRFDRRVRLEFRGATNTSDAGLLACRELDDAPHWRESPKTTYTDKKHGSRQESHPLSDRPEIDWPCRT